MGNRYAKMKGKVNMTVKELIKLLQQFPLNTVVDMASDEEGNSFGDISDSPAQGFLKKSGKAVVTLYPENCQDGIERYKS